MRALRLSPMLRRFRREDGNATVEFTILVPLLFMIFFATLEAGLMMLRWASIDRASDMVIRDLRLGLIPNPTQQLLRQEICDRVFMIDDCFENSVVEITEINRATFAMPQQDAPCVTRNNQILVPVTQITPGQQNDLMLIRVCVTADALMPSSTYSLPIAYDARGGYALSVASVYVNEPS